MDHEPAPRFRLHALGSGELFTDGGERVGSVLAQPRRLCLLVHLALAPHPVTRGALAALFWPESDETRARNALSQAVFYLRRSLGKGVVEAHEGDRIWVRPDLVWCDARELLYAEHPALSVLGAGERELLEGWNAHDSQPLQEWLDATRRRLSARRASLTAPAPGESDGAGAGARSDAAPMGDGGRRRTSRVAAKRPPRWSRRVAAAASVALAFALAMGPQEPGSAEASVRTPTLVVLQPIWAGTGTPPAGLDDAIVTEVLGSLSTLDPLEVRDASFLTPRADIGRALDAIGQEDAPELALRIVLTMHGSGIKARVNLSGPMGLALGGAVADLTFSDLDQLVWEAPDSIAATALRSVVIELERRGRQR